MTKQETVYKIGRLILKIVLCDASSSLKYDVIIICHWLEVHKLYNLSITCTTLTIYVLKKQPCATIATHCIGQIIY